MKEYCIMEKNMNLQEKLVGFTTDELKTEIKRRREIEKEMKMAIPRCRNCKFAEKREIVRGLFYDFCSKRTYTYKKEYKRNYVIRLSNKACESYERKEK